MHGSAQPVFTVPRTSGTRARIRPRCFWSSLSVTKPRYLPKNRGSSSVGKSPESVTDGAVVIVPPSRRLLQLGELLVAGEAERIAAQREPLDVATAREHMQDALDVVRTAELLARPAYEDGPLRAQRASVRDRVELALCDDRQGCAVGD